ncbi:MAG: helix-turn-helix domain-containing protein, partial [bacterium]
SYYQPLERVREFVEKNLSEPISLRAAASAAGLEEKYFSAFFHRKTGVCFRDWLACRRVDRAIEILTLHDDTITSVAASVGFQDLRTFERAFKRLTGLTAREFKRSVAPEVTVAAAERPVTAPTPPSEVAPSPVLEAEEPPSEPREALDCDSTLAVYGFPLSVPSFLISTPAVARAPTHLLP